MEFRFAMNKYKKYESRIYISARMAQKRAK